ncbi:hypothetical protein FRC08_010820, partial [Ceratobasidium sp. 394]
MDFLGLAANRVLKRVREESKDTATPRRDEERENEGRGKTPRLLEFIACKACTLYEAQCVFDFHTRRCQECRKMSRKCEIAGRGTSPITG